MDGTGSKHILIVGGGVIGLCSAWHALERGHRVTLLDRESSDHDGCSAGNAGMIVPSHFIPLSAPGMFRYALLNLFQPKSPFSIKPRMNMELLQWGVSFLLSSNNSHVTRSAPILRDLNLASLCEYERLSERFSGSFEITKKGLLMLCNTNVSLKEEARYAQYARDLGLAAEELTPDQVREMNPNIQMNIAGGIHFPQDAHISPQTFMDALKKELIQRGADIHWSSEVIGWRVNKDRILAIQTEADEFYAEEYLIAAGTWTSTIVKKLNVNIPLQAGKGYSITLPNPRQKPTICSILKEARVAVTPMGDTLRFGGAMEISGLNEKVNQMCVQGMIESIIRFYPEFREDDFRNISVWHGLRPCSPDGMPYLGRLNRYSNLSVAAGHAMMGMSLGPITGKLIIEILSDEKPSINISALNPNRYS